MPVGSSRSPYRIPYLGVPIMIRRWGWSPLLFWMFTCLAAATGEPRGPQDPPAGEGGSTPGSSPSPPAARGLLLETLAEPPGFLGRVEAERAVAAGKAWAEVEQSLAAARRQMSDHPEQVEQDLKLMLESIDGSASLEAETRAVLRQRVVAAIRESRRRAVEAADRRAQVQQRAAAAQELDRLNQSLAGREQQLQQIMARFESLMAEQRYQAAGEEVAPEVQRLAPDSSLDQSVSAGAQLARMAGENDRLWRTREKNFLLAMLQAEHSAIPFPMSRRSSICWQTGGRISRSAGKSTNRSIWGSQAARNSASCRNCPRTPTSN
jgi:hypothetical protein